MSAAEKVLHIELDNIVLVAVGLEIGGLRDGKSSKCAACVHGTVIVGRYHIGRHGFAEAARTAHAKIFFARTEHFVGIVQKSCLVHIDFGMDGLPEKLVSRIKVNTHYVASRSRTLALSISISQI